MFILVFRINLATLYCHDSKDAILALKDGIQTAQPYAIDGRITYFHKASPKEIRLKEPCSPNSFIYIIILLEITFYVVAKTQRSGQIYTYIFIFIGFL